MKLIYLSVTLTFFLLYAKNASAWSGYDYENNTTIEIGSGNLVREGNIVTIYDWEKDEYHDVDVKLVEGDSGGTRLEVYDMEDEINRVFIMEN